MRFTNKLHQPAAQEIGAKAIVYKRASEKAHCVNRLLFFCRNLCMLQTCAFTLRWTCVAKKAHYRLCCSRERNRTHVLLPRQFTSKGTSSWPRPDAQFELKYSLFQSTFATVHFWAPRDNYKSPRLLVSPNRSSSKKTIIWRLYWNTAWVRTPFATWLLELPVLTWRNPPLNQFELDC